MCSIVKMVDSYNMTYVVNFAVDLTQPPVGMATAVCWDGERTKKHLRDEGQRELGQKGKLKRRVCYGRFCAVRIVPSDDRYETWKWRTGS